MWSEIAMTMAMWCSTSRIVRSNWSRIDRIVSPSSSTSPWVSPLAGSSSMSSCGLGGERPGELDALERAERQAGDGPVGQRGEVEPLEQVEAAGRSLRSSRAAPMRSIERPKPDVTVRVAPRSSRSRAR